MLVGCATKQLRKTKAIPIQQVEPPTVKAPDISIHEAVATDNTEAVKQHLASGTDVNARNDGGYTPLHWVAVRDHKEIAELLIEKGADVNVEGNEGNTSLYWAAQNGHEEIVELLISKGADVNAKDVDGITPLDVAHAQPETAALLRKHGGKTGEELKAEGK